MKINNFTNSYWNEKNSRYILLEITHPQNPTFKSPIADLQ